MGAVLSLHFFNASTARHYNLATVHIGALKALYTTRRGNRFCEEPYISGQCGAQGLVP